MIKIKLFLYTMFSLITFISFINPSFSNECPEDVLSCGNPEVYKIAFQKFEISEDNGKTWVVLSDTPVTFDMASELLNGLTESMIPASIMIPEGNFNKIRVTLSNYLIIKGQITYPVGDEYERCYYTTKEGTNSVLGACGTDYPAADYGEYPFLVPNLTGPIVITKGVDLKVTVFDQDVKAVSDDVINRIGLSLDKQGAYLIHPIQQRKK